MDYIKQRLFKLSARLFLFSSNTIVRFINKSWLKWNMNKKLIGMIGAGLVGLSLVGGLSYINRQTNESSIKRLESPKKPLTCLNQNIDSQNNIETGLSGKKNNVNKIKNRYFLPIFQKQDKTLYFLGERHKEDNIEKIVSIIKDLNIDCLLVEGLEGNLDKISDKIKEDKKVLSDIEEKLAKGELKEFLYRKEIFTETYLTKNLKIFCPGTDINNFLGYSPGSKTYLELRKRKNNIPIFGIDDMNLYRKCLDFLFAVKIHPHIYLLKEESKNPKSEFYSEEVMKNSKSIISELERRFESLKQSSGYTESNYRYMSDKVVLDERDKIAVKKAIKILEDNNYNRGLIIRGDDHLDSIRRELHLNNYR